MGKKKHAEHVNHERWLVSYADLVTLLFAFFVVLFASSVSDKKKTAAMATAMKTAFDSHGAFDAHANTPPLAEGAGTSQGSPKPLEMPIETPGAGQLESVRKALELTVPQESLKHLVSMHEGKDGITLSLNSAGFFDSGSAEIKPSTLPVLAKIAAALPNGALRIEGHTDNHPIHTAQFRSNWELSTARAAAICQVLLATSTIFPANFSIAGYGEFHPVAPNATEAGRAVNRRVDIVILRQTTAAEKTTLANSHADASAAKTPVKKAALETPPQHIAAKATTPSALLTP